MQKSFKARLEALEALEAAAEASIGRLLDVQVCMRPADYYLYFETSTPDDHPDILRIAKDYGFDQIMPDDRPFINGNAWTCPSSVPAWERTIFLSNAPDGASCRIDVYTEETARFPPAGEWRIFIAVSEVVERMRRAAQLEELRNALAMLDSGKLYVQPFNPARDMRQYDKQLKHSCWVRGAESGMHSDDPRWPALGCLQRTLDSAQQRTTGAFCQSSDQARAVLVAEITRLEHSGHEPVQETT